MKKTITTATSLMVLFCSIFIPINTNAETDEINYLYDYDISYLVGQEYEPDEDIKMTLYGDEYPETAGEYDWICFLDEDWNYTGQCITEIRLSSTPRNGHTTTKLEFIMPEKFTTISGGSGYVEVRLETGEYYYTYYDAENMLYNYPNQIFVLGLEAFLYGNNLSSGASITIGTNDGSVDPILYEDNIIYLEMETRLDNVPKQTYLFLNGDRSNKIDIYVAPQIFDDPWQIMQGYFVQSDLYVAYDELYEPTDEVVVAVIDTGVDINHEDLENSIWVNENEITGNGIDDDNNGYIDDIYGWTYRLEESGYIIDPINSHGTSVAGIIAAEQDNEKGIVGLASNTKIMSLDVFSSSGIDMDYVIEAIYYAADNGADIINLSLGGSAYNTYSTKYDAAIEYAYKKGCLIVASAGNGNDNSLGGEGINLNNIPSSPICNDGENDMVLGVTSVDGYNELSSFSNYGSNCVDLAALGEEVMTTIWESEGTYSNENYGTSFSAPIVSGIAAMLKSQYPDLENWQIQYLLEETGTDIANEQSEEHEDEIGKLVNATSAFEQVETIEFPDKPEILDEPIEIFSDLSSTHKNAGAINYLYNQGIIGGYSDGTFQPNNAVNRAELLKILVEGKGITPVAEEYNNCFPDVTNDWYAPYVCYAKEQGWVDGYPDGTFQPANTVNKVEALKMLINSQEIENQISETVEEEMFSDTDNSAWYAPYLKLAKDLEILEETEGEFEPSGEMNRGGICENLYRLLMILEG